MQKGIEGFRGRGVQIIAIGQGTGDEAAHYCGKAGAEFPCLGDPHRESYASLGLQRGTWWNIVMKDLLLDPVETVKLIMKADLKAAALPASDPLQLGGVTIVDAEGTLRYRHVAQKTADMPSNEEIFAALDQLAAS